MTLKVSLASALLWSAAAALALPSASMAAAGADDPSLPPASTPAPAAPALKVCADPDSLPFSNDRGEGLENRIAEILGREMKLPVEYVWQSQRRGFLRRSLNAKACDLVVGAPVGLGGLLQTRPYYRSAYVLVARKAGPAPSGLDDPQLRSARIGLYAVGMEGANTPAAMALAERHITARVEGFPLVGADDRSAPAAARVIDAVAAGDIDVAFVWGPFAGYFARAHAGRLSITPVLADPCLPQLAFAYDMAAGVRTGDVAFRDRVQAALDRRRAEVDAVLADYGVPLVTASPALVTTAAHNPADHPPGAASCASDPS